MTLAEFYKYSWFSNMSYVFWDDDNTAADPEAMRDAANERRRVPTSLGDQIFGTLGTPGWTIPSFAQNDAVGFAANVFANGTEKVLN